MSVRVRFASSHSLTVGLPSGIVGLSEFCLQEALEATHKPVLISSEKIRNKAKSTGYGTKVIGKKPQKPIEAPTFTPNLKVGKGTGFTPRRFRHRSPNDDILVALYVPV